MIADGMATAITVLGPEAGFEFALKEELPIFMIVRKGNEFIEKMTPNFEQFLTKVE
jgi:thiamine biosynthesis lipoprotein